MTGERRSAIRVNGHRLSVEWSGEYGPGSSSTGTCICGWEESASSQREVRQEYRWHLRNMRAQKQADRYDETGRIL